MTERNRSAAAENVVMLSFQRLDVYQRAIEFLALVYDIVDVLPRGHAERADQLTRAAESVVRNIAEGAGEFAPADKAALGIDCKHAHRHRIDDAGENGRIFVEIELQYGLRQRNGLMQR